MCKDFDSTSFSLVIDPSRSPDGKTKDPDSFSTAFWRFLSEASHHRCVVSRVSSCLALLPPHVNQLRLVVCPLDCSQLCFNRPRLHWSALGGGAAASRLTDL